MGSIFKAPKMPAPPPLVMPEEKDVPSLEDEAREKEAAEEVSPGGGATNKGKPSLAAKRASLI